MTAAGDEEPFGSRGQLVSRLATNTIAQALGTAAGAVIGFFTFISVARGLGPDAFGDLTAAMVFLWIPVALADVGLSQAVVREISAHPERTELAVRAFWPFRALIGAAAVGIALAVGAVAPFDDRTHLAIWIGSVGAFLSLLTLAFVPVLEAQLKMAWAVGASLLGRIATLALTLAALGLDLGFASIVWAQVAGYAVTLVAQTLIIRRIVPLRPQLDLQYSLGLLRGSLALGAALSLAMIYFRIDTVLLALLATSRDVGLYAASYRFLELAALVIGAIGVSVFPPLAHFVATGDPRVRGLVQRTFDVLVAAAVPIAIVMLAFAEPIVELTSGPAFVDGAIALQVLAPYVVLTFVGAIFWRVLMATGRDRTMLAIAVAILTVNVVANAILLPRYGFEAAAVVSVSSEAVLIVLTGIAARRVLGFLPSARYVGVVALAAAAMTLVIVVLPGPAVVVASAAVLVYAGVMAAAPGTVRQVVRQLPSAAGR